MRGRESKPCGDLWDSDLACTRDQAWTCVHNGVISEPCTQLWFRAVGCLEEEGSVDHSREWGDRPDCENSGLHWPPVGPK